MATKFKLSIFLVINWAVCFEIIVKLISFRFCRGKNPILSPVFTENENNLHKNQWSTEYLEMKIPHSLRDTETENCEFKGNWWVVVSPNMRLFSICVFVYLLSSWTTDEILVFKYYMSIMELWEHLIWMSILHLLYNMHFVIEKSEEESVSNEHLCCHAIYDITWWFYDEGGAGGAERNFVRSEILIWLYLNCLMAMLNVCVCDILTYGYLMWIVLKYCIKCIKDLWWRSHG